MLARKDGDPMHRLCDQREADKQVHAKEQKIVPISHLENSHQRIFRQFHPTPDHPQHCNVDDQALLNVDRVRVYAFSYKCLLHDVVFD